MNTHNPNASPSLGSVRADADAAVNGLLRRVYQVGGVAVAALLVIGLVYHLLRGGTMGFDAVPQGVAGWRFRIALLVLWAVPTASLFVAGLGWLRRRRSDPAGWLAMSIGIFLISLWIV
jgi:hypothetical protein